MNKMTLKGWKLSLFLLGIYLIFGIFSGMQLWFFEILWIIGWIDFEWTKK